MARCLRAVLFDMYGTLFLPPEPAEAERAWVGACHRELAARGLRADEERLRRGLLGARRIARLEGLTPFESRIHAVSRELGLALDHEQLRRVADEVCNRWQRMLRLDPDAAPALVELGRGRRLGLVSNYDHPRHVKSVLRETGLERFFERVVVSGEVGVEKPDPAILALALQGTGLRPEEAAYVGDSVVDFEAAHAAGLLPVIVRRPGQAPGDAPAHLRDRYGDPDALITAACERGDAQVVGALSELPALLT